MKKNIVILVTVCLLTPFTLFAGEGGMYYAEKNILKSKELQKKKMNTEIEQIKVQKTSKTESK